MGVWGGHHHSQSLLHVITPHQFKTQMKDFFAFCFMLRHQFRIKLLLKCYCFVYDVCDLYYSIWCFYIGLISFQRRISFNPNCFGVFMLSLAVNDGVVFHPQEFPFFTLTSFPPGFLVHVGGVVSARSVKLLDRIHNPGEFSAHERDTSRPLSCKMI